MGTVTEFQVRKKSDDLLWKRYDQTKSEEVREKLLFRYLPLVRQIAGRIMGKLPQSVMLDELIDAGVIGLLEAIDRFDQTCNVKFETYAYTRVRGAIMDELRKMDWAPRSLREKSKQVETAVTELEKILGRVPVNAEVAEKLGISLKQYSKMAGEVGVVNPLSLDSQMTHSGGENGNLYDFIEQQDEESPIWNLEDRELKQNLVAEIEDLPQTEKLVIALYYYEELTLKEIGEVLELSESRVSQIHTKVVGVLREKLSF